MRDYSPEMGRNIERDPLGLSAGSNFYSYVKQNPLNLLDPFGLIVDDCKGRPKFSMPPSDRPECTRNQLGSGVDTTHNETDDPIGPWIYLGITWRNPQISYGMGFDGGPHSDVPFKPEFVTFDYYNRWFVRMLLTITDTSTPWICVEWYCDETRNCETRHFKIGPYKYVGETLPTETKSTHWETKEEYIGRFPWDQLFPPHAPR